MTNPAHSVSSGLANAWVLDAIAYDTRTDRVVLAMFETRTWTGGDAQAFQLQEKLNAYVSFVLDGEMQETYPEFAGKKTCIQLRTVHSPDDRTLGFIALAREQLAFQDVDLETILIGDEGAAGCGCGSGTSCCG